ncbi:hypothetical protein [Marinobacter orientalis]|uniref:hypothetical protein n=1 Tax=Marinobacter orientalis TaxID=1928859 RepID=UPI001D17E6D8|nr:hypothetical protein [Marinobacter orientalis]
MRYLKTRKPLEGPGLLELDHRTDNGQLELPGLAFSDGDNLFATLDVLEQEISRVQLSEEEVELLRRFRKTSDQNRRMIMHILGR